MSGIALVNSHLAHLRSILSHRTEKPQIHAVLGNESADLDSMASAVLYAIWKNDRAKKTLAERAYVPVINIPRKDFSLRTECVHLFKKLGLKSENLIFADEFDLSRRPLKLTLVDHNHLAPSQEHLGPLVRRIIDHHKDDSLYSPKERKIELVGSCTTLVMEVQDEVFAALSYAKFNLDLFSSKSILADPNLHKFLDADLATLALCTIAIDTFNLDPKLKRATEKDIRVINQLQSICPSVNRDQLYQEVLHAKLDLQSLSLEDVMRRDAKDFDFGAVRVGVPSVPMPLANLVKKHSESTLLKNWEEYCSHRGIHLLVIMTLYNDESTAGSPLARELLFYLPKKHQSGQHSKTFANLKEYFERNSELQLEPMKIGAAQLESNPSVAGVYRQKNVAASRKQVQPLLASFFAQHKL